MYFRREFSKYGKIHKLVIGTNSNSAVNTVYVTYSRPEDAIKAIQGLNNQTCNGNSQIIMNGFKEFKSFKNGSSVTLRASLGTTKYCTHWLKNQQCPKLPECKSFNLIILFLCFFIFISIICIYFLGMYLHELAESEASFTKEEMQQGKHTEYEKKLINQYLSKKMGTSMMNQKKLESFKKDVVKQNVLNQENECSELICKERENKESGEHTMIENKTLLLERPKNEDNKLNINSLDEIIGVSSDSSTSFSTCSSGSSCPPNILLPVEDEALIDSEISKEIRCKSPEDDSMPSPSPSPGLIVDDDDLDFDPITVSTTGLQDLIKNDSPTCSLFNSSSTHINSKCNLNQAPLSDDKSHLSQAHLFWRNSLKALLPNVNITFSGSATSTSSSSYYKSPASAPAPPPPPPSPPPLPPPPPTQTQQTQQQPQAQQQPSVSAPQQAQSSIPFSFSSQLLINNQPNNLENHSNWFHQTHLHSNQSKIFNISPSQSSHLHLNRLRQGYITQPVLRQKHPPPGFANF